MNDEQAFTGYPAEDLVALVSELAAAYISHESTSITVDTAQQLWAAMEFCLRAGEAACPDALQTARPNARNVYQAGCRALRQKADTLRRLYNRLLPDFDSFCNSFLEDTFVRGLAEFLKWYDLRFCPQDTILTLDYPVLCAPDARGGIHTVLDYARMLELEQRFLHRFGAEYVQRALKTAGLGPFDVCNLPSVILQTVLGRLLAKTPPEHPLTPADVLRIQQQYDPLNAQTVRSGCETALTTFLRRAFPQDEAMLQYLRGEVHALSARFCTALEHGSLIEFFFSFSL